MSITRAQIKYEIYQKLNKSPTTRGFYTDEKSESAIAEVIDFIAVEMFFGDEGWAHKIDYFDTVANVVKVDIPPHIAMIAQVRYLIGNTYLPLQYDQDFGSTNWSSAAGLVQFPSRYRVIDNAIYFNPAVGVGGPQYLQIEYQAYPKRMTQDTDYLDSQFDRAMMWMIVYKSCSIMVSNIQQFQRPWADLEAQWYDKVLNIINKRNQSSTAIQAFEGFAFILGVFGVKFLKLAMIGSVISNFL